MKGQGVHTFTLVIMIVIIFFSAIVIYDAFIGHSFIQIGSATCATQTLDYCGKWWSQSQTFDSANAPTWNGAQDCPKPTCGSCIGVLNKVVTCP